MKNPCETQPCGPGSSMALERNNYFYGKTLTARDFEDEQRYFNEKRWLINRTVHGWGVVCGLHIEKGVLLPGVALDCHGREIQVPCEVNLDLDAWKKKVKKDYHASKQEYDANCPPKQSGEFEAPKWYVCLKYTPCKTQVVADPVSSCDGRTQAARIRDWYEVKLVRESELCLPKPRDFECPELKLTPESETKKPPTLHRVLCDEVSRPCGGCCEPGCDKMCDCVPLATLQAEVRKGGIGVAVDTCTDRRLVVSNPLLARLYACEHGTLPPQVMHVSWEDLLLTAAKSEEGVPTHDFWALVHEGPFEVRFSQSMDTSAFTNCAVRVTVVAREKERAYYRRRYDVEVEATPIDDHTLQFVLDQDWVDFGWPQKGNASLFHDAVTVEIELVSPLLRSADRTRVLDGEPPAITKDGELHYPSGEGSDGGNFISCIRLQAWDEKTDCGPEQQTK